jgi:diguanylate cyclase (GGDEF)-like protein
MGSLEALSEALIDTLKRFSAEKRPVTAAALTEAFSERGDIFPLLASDKANQAGQGESAPRNSPARVVLPESETLKRQERTSSGGKDGVSDRSELPGSGTLELLPEVRNFFSKMLESLGRVVTGNCESRFCYLQKKINGCESLPPIWLLVEEIVIMFNESINRTVEKMEYSKDFLVELGKDLCKMEEQLSAYKNFNQEVSQINSEFNDNLLSHTDELHRTFTSGKKQEDIYNLILSKLKVISKAIEIKEESDMVRLKEADAKIADLQQNLRTYNQEIAQVTQRAQTLEKVVLLDELTMINNRRAYDLQIRECMRRLHQFRERFSLILIDIDLFKRINDDYGHRAGDKCLREIAQLIKSSLRESDFLARYGGDELIAILYGSNSESALNVAEKIRRKIEEARFHYLDRIIPMTISLGVTEVQPCDTDPDIPFLRVDKAMYQAKKDGGNKICRSCDVF